MASDTLDTRVAVLEQEVRHVAERQDRELATKSDIGEVRTEIQAVRTEIQTAKNGILMWMFSLILAQPIIWLGIIAVAKRTGLLDIILGS